MNRIFTALAIVAFAAILAAPAAESASPSGSTSLGDPLAKGNNTFAAQLYRELAAKPGNLFFSPYSVSTALGMAYAGARGQTAEQIAQALHFQMDQARLNKAFKRVSKDLLTDARKNGNTLNIADGLSLTGGPVAGQFEATLKNDYDAELFSGGVERINAWVRRKTEGRIDRIIDQLSPNSVCVILNAIYFKGLWSIPFSKELTRNEPFNISSTKRVTVPLMYRRYKLKMLDEKDFQAVSIPYVGNDLSMVVLLPATTEVLAALEKRMSAAKLGEWLEKLDSRPVREVDLYLPRFTMETSYDLKPALMKMGMKLPFEKSADFSGVRTPKGGLWIGQIKHKGFLDVNEKGTEAAAATAVEMRALAMRWYPRFRADHPFFFLIRDNRNSMILFMGRETDPRDEKPDPRSTRRNTKQQPKF
ncbi:MAG: serpin family protein [Syntrophobacteraceae bacterium]|nr:serpin family protein [Syntrophobacteraceae bacterium]